jgi:hypothetical protein
MESLSDPDFLVLWERGRRFDPLDQALLALAAAFPETSYENLADWPLGRRNRALAELRCACFGSVLEGWTACPLCGEKLEFEMDGRALAGEEMNRDFLGEKVVVNGHAFRLPTSRDLARVVREADSRLAAIRLMETCRVEGGDSPVWDEEYIEEIGEKMALADPMAEIRLALNCPECGNAWDETLNISAFLWAEIESRARRLLTETHTLASAYGWTEKEIFSLSGPRRALYMEMVQR